MSPAQRIAVAASGGRDSTALLHCTARAAAALGIDAIALHVHHGLAAAADDWLAHVRRQCRRWGVAFDSRRLGGAPARGESVEAWARRERYRALLEMARLGGCSMVLLAHHRRDQAETFVLQALRGGGPAGLAAMPESAVRGGITWARPWLKQPREVIDAYIRRHRLRHVDDTSNGQPQHDRNRLRLDVWPALVGGFPHAETSLAQAARRSHEAASLAAEVAALDLPALSHGAALDVLKWQALPPARQRNVLRAWLAQAIGGAVPETLVERLAIEVPGRATGQWQAPTATLRLYRGLLQASAKKRANAAAGTPARARAVVAKRLPQGVDLAAPGQVAVAGWEGHFEIEPVLQGGAVPALLQGAVLCERRGGERFRFSADAEARCLKKQFQARAVPAWQRHGPLIYSAQGRLVFVPGLGIEASAQASPGELQWGLAWCADPPLPTAPP